MSCVPWLLSWDTGRIPDPSKGHHSITPATGQQDGAWSSALSWILPCWWLCCPGWSLSPSEADFEAEQSSPFPLSCRRSGRERSVGGPGCWRMLGGCSAHPDESLTKDGSDTITHAFRAPLCPRMGDLGGSHPIPAQGG